MRLIKIRAVILWLTLAGIFLLAGLCVYGAFIGPGRARDLFNSVPLSIFWLVLVELIVLGFISWRNRKPGAGMLAIHLGVLLILCGAMWGSQYAHNLRKRWLDQDKICLGQIQLHPSQQAKLGQLQLQLRNAWVEYYPPAEPGWGISFVTCEAASGKIASESIVWQKGKRVQLGSSEIGLNVLEYVTDESIKSPALLVCNQDGKIWTAQPKPGSELSPPNTDVKLRIVRVLENALLVEGDDGEVSLVDQPKSQGEKGQPVLEVEFPSQAGRGVVSTYVFRPKLMLDMIRMGMPQPAGTVLMYLPTPPERHGRLAPPAVLVELSRDDKKGVLWLAADEGSQQEQLPLAMLFPSEAEWIQAGAPTVILTPNQAVRDYKADLIVADKSGSLARKVVEINHPLHFGGYHFYLTESDETGQAVTILARSDSGLWTVYCGFGVLMFGLIFNMWLRPAWRKLKKKSSPAQPASQEGVARDC